MHGWWIIFFSGLCSLGISTLGTIITGASGIIYSEAGSEAGSETVSEADYSEAVSVADYSEAVSETDYSDSTPLNSSN